MQEDEMVLIFYFLIAVPISVIVLSLIFLRLSRRRASRRPDVSDRKGSMFLPERDVKHIQETHTCPYCKNMLMSGPEAAVTANVYCVNLDQCNSSFNVSLFPNIYFGQFLGPVPESARRSILAGSNPTSA